MLTHSHCFLSFSRYRWCSNGCQCCFLGLVRLERTGTATCSAAVRSARSASFLGEYDIHFNLAEITVVDTTTVCGAHAWSVCCCTTSSKLHFCHYKAKCKLGTNCKLHTSFFDIDLAALASPDHTSYNTFLLLYNDLQAHMRFSKQRLGVDAQAGREPLLTKKLILGLNVTFT